MQSKIGWFKNDLFFLLLMVHQFFVFQLQISKKYITMKLISTMHYIIVYAFWTHNLVPPNGKIQTGLTFKRKPNGTLMSKDLLLTTLNMHKEE
jgi:hypothetical protein